MPIRHFARRGDIKALFAADQSVSGDWTFDGGAVFTKSGLTLTTSAIRLNSDQPCLVFSDADAGSDNKHWQIRINTERFFDILARNDADNAVTAAMRFQRTGMTIDEIELNATTLDFNGALSLGGDLTLDGGNATVQTSGTSTLVLQSAGTVSLRGGGSSANGAAFQINAGTQDALIRAGGIAGANNRVIVRDANIEIRRPLLLFEQAAPVASAASLGQLWVKNTTPCELWFTDDAGNDTKIA